LLVATAQLLQISIDLVVVAEPVVLVDHFQQVELAAVRVGPAGE
jgi:hypothetical protein